MGGRGGPDLGTRRRELIGSVSSIAGVMWNHGQGMVAEFARRGISHTKFSGEEMADIIAYLYFVNYAAVRGTPARGARLFDERCSTCHTVSGGSRLGPDLAAVPQLDDPIAIIAAMWNHAPRMEQESRKLGVLWPRFRLGDTADLAAFLIERRSQPPRPPAGAQR
jgi:cytochrome c2